MAGERLLIAEDEPEEGDTLAALMREHHYDVLGVASTADDAVERARASQPDLVLMDLGLPPVDGQPLSEEGGLRAAREIRLVSPGTLFVWVTGQAIPDERLDEIHRFDPTASIVTKPRSRHQTLLSVRLALLQRRGTVVFLCYAREDAKYKNELVKFMQSGQDVGVDAWDDGMIRFGDNWKQEIESAIRRAHVAILLISNEFVNSKFIRRVELPNLLAATVNRSVRIIPVFVGAITEVSMDALKLRPFHTVNGPDDPLNRWSRPKREAKAWVPLCELLFKNSNIPHG